MKALETFGLQGHQSLQSLAEKRLGGPEQVAHEIRLLTRRLRYAVTVPGPRNFPAADQLRRTGRGVVRHRADWTTADYVAWFEAANNLKGTTNA